MTSGNNPQNVELQSSEQAIWQRRNLESLIANTTIIIAIIALGIFLSWIGDMLKIIGVNNSNGTGLIEAGYIVFSLGLSIIALALFLLAISKMFTFVFSKTGDDRWVRVFLIITGTVIIIYSVILLETLTSFG